MSYTPEQIKENREDFLEALRGNVYKQTTGRLKHVNDEGEESFCCLGVACDRFRVRTGKGVWKMPEANSGWDVENPVFSLQRETAFTTFDKNFQNFMPREVVEYLGLPSAISWDDPVVDYDFVDKREGGKYPLRASKANDEERWDFVMIAEGFERLFEKVDKGEA